MEWPRFTGWVALLLAAMAWLAGANDDYLVTFPNVPSATIMKGGYVLGWFPGDQVAVGQINITSELPAKKDQEYQEYRNSYYHFGDGRDYGYLPVDGQDSLFLSRLDNYGEPLWGVAFTAADGFAIHDTEGTMLSPKDMAVDEDGNAYVLVRICVHG